MHEEHCFSRFRKFYVYLVLYTIEIKFLAATSSSRSDDVTLSVCLLACLLPYFLAGGWLAELGGHGGSLVVVGGGATCE